VHDVYGDMGVFLNQHAFWPCIILFDDAFLSVGTQEYDAVKVTSL